MNPSLETAIIEAYATAPTNVAVLETLEIRHSSIPASIYLVRNNVDLDLTLETAEVKTFRAAAFQMTLPAVDDSGLQEIPITMDDIEDEITDFLNAAKGYEDPVQVVFRPYLSTDLTTPQYNPPLVLSLRNASAVNGVVTGRASFVDLINAKFLTELYSRQRFPSLGEL